MEKRYKKIKKRKSELVAKWGPRLHVHHSEGRKEKKNVGHSEVKEKKKGKEEERKRRKEKKQTKREGEGEGEGRGGGA